MITFQKVYREAKEELQSGQASREILFSHCMDTCQKLFEIAEFKVGKSAVDIPREVMMDIEDLYDEAFECFLKTHDDKELELYDYPTSINSFSECLKVSMDELIKSEVNLLALTDENAKQSLYEAIKSEVKSIYGEYLPKFFGLHYSKEYTREQRYELIRLTKILYDCKKKFNIGLEYLIKPSILRTSTDIATKCQEAILFVKERVIMRSATSDYIMSFKTIMELERFVSAARSFINSFPETSVKDILSYIDDEPDCSTVRFVQERIYDVAIENLKRFVSAQKLDDPKCIQLYAYLHFLFVMDTLPLLETIESMNSSKSELIRIEMNEYQYRGLDIFHELNDIAVEEIDNFVKKYKNELLNIIFPNIKNKSESVKHFKGLKRHVKNYETIVRFFNSVNGVDCVAPIKVRTVVLLMYFYECLKEKQVHIPLYSGYNENKRKRAIKVDEFLNKIKKGLEERNTGDFTELSDSEIFIAGVWLREKIRYMSDFRTKKIDDQIINLRKLLGDFFAFKVKSIHKCPPNVFPKLD